jgi:creatinine amidohydrolase
LCQINVFADYLLERYKVLIAPAIQDNFFPAFEKYAGSSSLSFNTSRDYIIEKCRVWANQGAKKFYVLNTGISTNKPLAAAKEALFKEGIILEYLNIASLYKNEKINAIMKQPCGTHADEIETSIMLYINPEVVHMEYAKPEAAQDKGDLTPDKNANPEYYTISETGAWGDPTLATIEKGKIAVDIIKEMIVKDINLMQECKTHLEFIHSDTKYFIRDMQQSDIESLVDYWSGSDEKYWKSIGVNHTNVSPPEELKKYFELFLKPDSLAKIFIIAQAKIPIGYVMLTESKEDGFKYAHTHGFDPDLRGQGIATLCFPEIMKLFALEFNVTKLKLQTFSEDIVVNKLLKRQKLTFTKKIIENSEGILLPGEHRVYDASRLLIQIREDNRIKADLTDTKEKEESSLYSFQYT